jgi:type I restriction enzyme S subunit
LFENLSNNYLNTEILSSLPFVIPPLPEQRAIAAALGALDDKIELNRRLNRTLEAMGRALFKSWFVDFDPVRARMVGRPAGLPAEIEALFPEEMEEGRPRGWGIGSLGEICEKPQYGYTASAEQDPVGPKFLRITDINKAPWIDWTSVPYCQIEHNDGEKYRLNPGDIVIARMADPGHGAYIEDHVDAVFASYLIRFRPKLREYGRYLQYWIRSQAYWNLVDSRKSGTTRANLNAQVLSEFPIVLPPVELLAIFGETVEPLREKLTSNILQSATLGTLRDALLPKLMSGEVRARDVEREVADAL